MVRDVDEVPAASTVPQAWHCVQRPTHLVVDQPHSAHRKLLFRLRLGGRLDWILMSVKIDGGTDNDPVRRAATSASEIIVPVQQSRHSRRIASWLPQVRVSDWTRVTGTPESERPSAGWVTAVAILVCVLLLGAGFVTIRQLGFGSGVGSVECWDGAVRAAGACGQPKGQRGLRWVFSATPEFDHCQVGEPLGVGELEVWQCGWADSDARVYLSRWESPGAAADYESFAISVGQPDVNRGGQVWSSPDLDPTTTDDAAYAFAYSGFPYSFVVMGSLQARDEAVPRIGVRSVKELATQV